MIKIENWKLNFFIIRSFEKLFILCLSYYCILIPINIKISVVQNLMKSSSYKFNKEFFLPLKNVYTMKEKKN